MKPVVVRWLLSAQDNRSHAVTETADSPISTVTARCGHQIPSFAPASPAHTPESCARTAGPPTQRSDRATRIPHDCLIGCAG